MFKQKEESYFYIKQRHSNHQAIDNDYSTVLHLKCIENSY